MANEPDPPRDQPSLQRRLATILAADVAGYSRMMGENEELTVRTLREHRAVFDALLKQHHGRVFNTAGDAILAEFPSAVEAVRCATEIQAALQTRNAHLPADRQMLFRMGVNLGDVVVQDGDLLGDGVNVAARIQTIAEPGGICISGSVYDQIQNKLSLQFKPLGGQSFKNIGQPIRTFTITHGESGALPAALHRSVARSAVALGGGALVIAALATGGYWLYRDHETRRVEQDALVAQLAAQKEATENARRAVDEQSRRAIDAERARLDQDKQRLDAEMKANAAARQAKAAAVADASPQRVVTPKRSAEPARSGSETSLEAAGATRNVAVAAAKAPTAGSGGFDGMYGGRVCNVPADASKKGVCWMVALNVQNGVGTGTWTMRLLGKSAYVRATIAPQGAVRAVLDGWKVSDASPMSGAMNGRLVDNRIDVEGRWSNGARVEGHWTRSP